MATESLWCLVRGTVVERVLDDEGRVRLVICPEYDGRAATCHLKGGILNNGARLPPVEQVPDDPLDRPAARCLLR